MRNIPQAGFAEDVSSTLHAVPRPLYYSYSYQRYDTEVIDMKKIATSILSLIMCVACAAPAFAAYSGRPDMAKLEDNVLEFNEIDDLIHVYNATVKENEHKLDAFSSVDGSVEDSTTMRYTYKAAEATLAKQAKTMMITYHNTLLDARKAELNVQLLNSALGVAQTRAGIGMATQVDVLSATESLINAQKAQAQAASSVLELKKTLQVMCGWKYESDAAVAELPEPDFARIDTMNPAADLETAIKNNFTLNANLRRQSNTESSSDYDTYGITATSNRQSIANSLNTAYANVLAARDAYNYASVYLSLEEKNLAQVNAKYAVGSASSIEQQTQQITTEIARIAFAQARNNVLQAITNYDYEVEGLAGAGM